MHRNLAMSSPGVKVTWCCFSSLPTLLCLPSGWMHRRAFSWSRCSYYESHPHSTCGEIHVYRTQKWWGYILPLWCLVTQTQKPVRWRIMSVKSPVWHFCTCTHTPCHCHIKWASRKVASCIPQVQLLRWAASYYYAAIQIYSNGMGHCNPVFCSLLITGLFIPKLQMNVNFPNYSI